MQPKEFAQLVADALDNLYDQASLQTHRLGDELGIAPTPGETRAEALRRLLHEAVESLRPPSSVPQSQPEWLPYRVLSLHYLGSWMPHQVCEELAFSLSSFYRQRHKALEAVASVLWGQRAGTTTAGEERAPAAEAPYERTLRDLATMPSETVSLATLLDGVVRTLEPLAQRRGVRLQLSCPHTGSTICVASDVLRQIMVGMLADCIAMIEDVTLPIQLYCQKRAIVCLAYVQNAQALVRQQWDESACEGSFWRGLVEAYDGRIWACADVAGREALGVSIPLPASLASVLIVDDDRDAIALYRRHLEPAGYVVHAAHNETEVREMLARITPDVILLDIILPQRDGWTVLGDLSADSRVQSIPVIVCSVAAHAPLARSLGAAAVLAKPVTREQLLQTIGQCLKRGDTED